MSIKDITANITTQKVIDGHAVFYNGNNIGFITKGWSRLGGNGWSVIFRNGQPYKYLSATYKNLNDAKRNIADRINQYEKSKVTTNTP